MTRKYSGPAISGPLMGQLVSSPKGTMRVPEAIGWRFHPEKGEWFYTMRLHVYRHASVAFHFVGIRELPTDQRITKWHGWIYGGIETETATEVEK